MVLKYFNVPNVSTQTPSKYQNSITKFIPLQISTRLDPGQRFEEV